MIPLLTVDEIRTVIQQQKLEHPRDDPGRWAQEIARAHRRVLETCGSRRPGVLLRAGATAIMVGSAHLDAARGRRLQPLSFAICQYWLDKMGFEIQSTQADREVFLRRTLGAEGRLIRESVNGHVTVDPVDDMDYVREWLEARIIWKRGNVSLFDLIRGYDESKPPTCFVGTAVTKVEVPQLAPLEEVVQTVTSTLAPVGIKVYAPLLQDSPRRGRSWSDRPSARAADERQLGSACLTILLLAELGVGLGSNAEIATKYCQPLVVIKPPGSISPMISGLGDGVEVLDMGDDLTKQLIAYLRGSWPRLLAHHLQCQHESARWATEIEAFMRDCHDDVRGAYQQSGSRLAKARFLSLLSDPFIWGGASRVEAAELEAIALASRTTDLAPPVVRLRKIRGAYREALEQAAHEAGWSIQVVRVLAADAEELLDAQIAQGGQRVSPWQPAFWYGLHKERFGG